MTLRNIFSALIMVSGLTLVGQAPDWQVDAGSYEHSMFITGVVVDEQGALLSDANTLIAAFSDDEVRGVSNLSYEAAIDTYVAYLLVYSNIPGESITFKVYDAANDVQFDIIESQTFVTDDLIGNLNDPFHFRSDGLSDEASITAFSFTDVIEEVSIDAPSIDVFLKENVGVTDLIAQFAVSDGASVVVSDVAQVSGETANDFSQTVTYEVTSASRRTVTNYTVTVTVGPFPQLAGIDPVSVYEGVAFDAINLESILTNYDANAVRWIASSKGEILSSVQGATLSLSAPNSDWYGTDVVEVVAQDTSYPDLTDTIRFDVEVININDAPVFTSDPIVALEEGELYQYEVTFSDVDADVLDFELVTGPDWMQSSESESGAVLFGLPPEAGTYEVNMQVSDGAIATKQNFIIQIESPILGLNHTPMMEVYPNPFVNGVYFSDNSIRAVKLLDMSGKVVLQQASAGISYLDLSHVAAGSYSLIIVDKEGRQSATTIVKGEK